MKAVKKLSALSWTSAWNVPMMVRLVWFGFAFTASATAARMPKVSRDDSTGRDGWLCAWPTATKTSVPSSKEKT